MKHKKDTEYLPSIATLDYILHINRFKQEIETSGYVSEDGRAHCISPLLYESGLIPFEISRDGGLTFPHSATWLSAEALQDVFYSLVSAKSLTPASQGILILTLSTNRKPSNGYVKTCHKDTPPAYNATVQKANQSRAANLTTDVLLASAHTCKTLG
ncbi:unnamed protein product [Caretta caretta]